MPSLSETDSSAERERPSDDPHMLTNNDLNPLTRFLQAERCFRIETCHPIVLPGRGERSRSLWVQLIQNWLHCDFRSCGIAISFQGAEVIGMIVFAIPYARLVGGGTYAVRQLLVSRSYSRSEQNQIRKELITFSEQFL